MHQRDIIDNISSGVLGLDAEYRVRLINPAAEALLQLSEARLLGQRIFDVCGLDLPWRSSMDQAAREGRAIVRRGVRLDTRDGPASSTDLVVTPLDGVSGLSFLVELQPIDRMLRIKNEENLVSAEQTTRTVVRGLAHEIKNPLGGLRGAAQLLERELPKDNNLREYTGIIIQEADRLRSLVDRLLGPSKQLTLAATNIHEILEHCLQLISAEAGDRLVLLRDYDPSFPELPADRGQLIQALLNIMRNAMEATASQPRCELTVRTRSQRQFTIAGKRHRLVCRADIIDNGPGIPPDIRENLFMPMVSGRADGTGLGLSIAQDIVHRHGGLLSCESSPGNTCFSVFLPMET